jgi:DNA polymerase type B, organellar and viral
VSYENNLVFKMCGPQIGLVIGKKHNLKQYYNLFLVILSRIELTSNTYNIDRINGIEIMYREILPQPELLLKRATALKLPTRLVTLKETRDKFSNKILPLTTDTGYYGEFVNDPSKYLTLINNQLKITHPSKDGFSLNNKLEVFIYTPTHKSTPKVIIVSREIKKDHYIREVYDINTGILIVTAADIQLDTQSFIRRIKNLTLTIKNQKIVQIKINVHLPIIKVQRKMMVTERNNNIGAFDIETFMDTDGISKVYALGFKTIIDNISHLFYITQTENFNPSQLVLNCVNSMLVNKYHNFIFYTHNFGNFDVIFLYKILLDANEKMGYDYYILKTTMRDDTIIKLEISIKKDENIEDIQNIKTEKINKRSRYTKIIFMDSYLLLCNNLNKVSKDFKVQTSKGIFPHTFVSRSTLEYIGKTPDIKYFPSSVSAAEYEEVNSHQ